MSVFTQFVLYFTIYAFLGWVWELIYCRTTLGFWHWRGFLTIPLLPIYGFSVLAILLFVQPYVHNPFLVFLATAAVVTTIEFFSSWLIEKIFHIRLWDYSDMPLNVKGYVSLFTSLGFGVLGLLMVYIIHPLVASLVSTLSTRFSLIAAIIILAIITVDFVNSVVSLVKVRGYIKVTGDSLDDMQQYINNKIADLKQQQKKLRLNIEKWSRWNIKGLRQSFPGAVASGKTKNRRPSK